MEHWQLMVSMLGIQIAFGLIIAVLGFLIKRSIANIDKRLDDGDKKFNSICEDIVKLKETRGMDREYFAKEYVSKDDFIRDIHALDVKIDGVAFDVKDLLKMMQKENP